MSPFVQLLLALGSVAILLCLMAVVRHLARVWHIGSEVQRKLIHIGTGLYALCLPWLFPDRWPIYFLVGLTLAIMLILRMPNSRLGGTLHGVERHSYGDLLLAISVGLCLFLAGDQLHLYVLPIAVLTLADAAAALAGSTYGTRFFRVEDGEKSVEGSIVFFFVTLLISVTCLMFMAILPPANIIVLSLMVAGFGTLVEAASWRGYDNLFLPMGLLIFLSVHGNSPLLELIALAAVYALSIVTFKYFAPRFGLTNHAARVYVTTVFLLLAVTAVQNAIVPVLVLAAHAWSRHATPCQSKLPDLDIVAGLAIISFGWLLTGNASGWGAISFYGLTVIGMAVGLSAIALVSQPMIIRIFGLIGVMISACLIWNLIVTLNPLAANWNGPMWPNLVACLAVTAATASLFPQFFSRNRVTRITGVSLIIPLASYLFSINYSGIFS